MDRENVQQCAMWDLNKTTYKELNNCILSHNVAESQSIYYARFYYKEIRVTDRIQFKSLYLSTIWTDWI